MNREKVVKWLEHCSNTNCLDCEQYVRGIECTPPMDDDDFDRIATGETTIEL